MILSSSLRIRHANADAESFFDMPLSGIDVVRVLRHPEVREVLEAVSRERARQTTEIVVHKNVPRTLLVSVGPLRNGEPHDVDLLMTLADISDRIDAERSRSTFVANVSHELRSPLTTLLGAVDTLQGPAKDNPDARERFLDLMGVEARRMSRLVGDLLNLAKQEAQEHRRPETRVNLHGVLRQVIEALEASGDYRSGRVAFHLDGQPTVKGIEDDLFEAFRNLIENALRYSPPDSPVELRLVDVPSASPVRGDSIRVDVRDHGEGIEAEHLPRLTDRFYRVDKGRSREMGGTGLGLSIVKHIINRHHGRLQFSSDPGKGTTVSVHLPVD